MKRNIVKLETLSSGIEICSFSYIWSEVDYVGVMAQQVQAIKPGAVVLGDDGYFKVDYGSLGLRMLTLVEWQHERQALALAA